MMKFNTARNRWKWCDGGFLKKKTDQEHWMAVQCKASHWNDRFIHQLMRSYTCHVITSILFKCDENRNSNEWNVILFENNTGGSSQ
jgi:hypothetical protein